MKYLWSLANNRMCNYHQTQEYTMAAIKPLLSVCQSAQGKVKFPSSSANFCWPFFRADVSNPAKFLHHFSTLIKSLKIQSAPGCLKINVLPTVCAQRSTNPAEKRTRRPGRIRLQSVAWIRRWHILTHYYDAGTGPKRGKRDLKAQQGHGKTILRAYMVVFLMRWRPVWDGVIQRCPQNVLHLDAETVCRGNEVQMVAAE